LVSFVHARGKKESPLFQDAAAGHGGHHH